jgi:dihydrofolate synthase/folylpolyglutamate synthase
VVVTRSANPRAVAAETLASLAGGATHVEGDPRRALSVAKDLAGEEGVVLATGSIYLIADLLRPPGRRGATF